MCGIAGVLRFDDNPVSVETVTAMTRVLAHRGPDDEGVYVNGPVGLGQRRLAIIDLSPLGRQPMGSEDGSIQVTYNGEIYNFAEIREQLITAGHTFRSRTDTEVIVHAYEEWGTECVHRFNGMFAFGLWDGTRRRLWLARDRMGVKPLFYARLSDRFLFGSEIKALLEDPALIREVDIEALSYYLALNWTPAPLTMFKNVRQLLPGQYMTIDSNGTIKETTYWDLEFREFDNRSESELIDEFLSRLEASVKLRLVSDVPFGAFLSGGADSSSVSHFMAKNLTTPLKTFSIHFGEPTFDEDEYARAVAAHIGAEHHQRKVTADLAASLPRMVWHAEEPTADSSMLAVWHLARETRKHVTMVQSGDGADELLAGYETYQAHYLHRALRLVPRFVRRGVLAPLVSAMPVSDAKVSLDLKLRRFLSGADSDSDAAHACWRMINNAEDRSRLLSPIARLPETRANVIDLYRSVFAATNARHPLNRLLYVDSRFYLPCDMLVKVDRMTMAHALEARTPFLDYTLVEFMASLPPRLKLKNLRHKKYILKKSMNDKLPSHALWRKKQGFNVPVSRWMKNDLKSFVCDHLSTERINMIGLFDAHEVQRILNDHFEARADNGYRLWGLLTFSIWWRLFIQDKTD